MKGSLSLLLAALCLMSVKVFGAEREKHSPLAQTKNNIQNVIDVLAQNNITDGQSDLTKLKDSILLGVSPDRALTMLEYVEKQFLTIMVAKGLAEKLVLSGQLTPEVLNSVVVFPGQPSVITWASTVREWKMVAAYIAREIAVAISRDDHRAKYLAFLKYKYFFDAFPPSVSTDAQIAAGTARFRGLMFSLIADVGLLITYASGTLSPGWIGGITSLAAAPTLSFVALKLVKNYYRSPRRVFWNTLKKANIRPPTTLKKDFRYAWLKSILTGELHPAINWRYYVTASDQITDLKATMKNDYPCKINLAAIGVNGSS
jgi:hypothetical protein